MRNDTRETATAPNKGDILCVVYARYSSHTQGEQSIEGQLAAAHTYADAKGYTIIHEYVDRAMTGRNDNRTEFQRMLSDTSKKQFSVIIVWKVDRFGRNREEITFNKYRVKKNGVRVEYVAENMPEGPEGVILESVLEGMAEYYSLQLSQNIRRGNRASAEKCQSTGGNRPLGYKTDPETKKFVIDPDTAPTVKMIFDMYASGKTVAEIVAHMNELGLHTLRGGKFTRNSLHAMLKNEKYIGVYTFKDELRIEGGVPAIIDEETFEKVQQLLKTNRKAPAHTWARADYLLTDKLFCGMCGAGMVGESGTSHTGAKHNYYLCVKKKRERTCKKRAVRQVWIESRVIDSTRELLADDENVTMIVENTWQYYLAQNEAQEKLKLLKTQLSDVDRAINNLMKAIEAGILNDITKSRMDELSAQRTALAASIADHELLSGTALTKDYIRFYIEQFRQLDYSNEECKKRLINTFVNSVFVFDDHIKINYNYKDGTEVITLKELEQAAAEADDGEGVGFVHRALCSTKAHTYEPTITWFRDVFSVTIKTPRD